MTTIDYKEIIRLGSVWRNMHRRCYNPVDKNYHNYGGRGIYVHVSWHDVASFCEWALSSGSSSKLELDRVDVDGPYSPENCRWVTRKQNCNNKRNNHRISAFGETLTISEWSDHPKCVVPRTTLAYRLLVLNWEDVEKAITHPQDNIRKSGNPTKCKHGHEYTPENTYYSKGKPHLKKCRKCHSLRQSERYHKAKLTDKAGMYDE